MGGFHLVGVNVYISVALLSGSCASSTNSTSGFQVMKYENIPCNCNGMWKSYPMKIMVWSSQVRSSQCILAHSLTTIPFSLIVNRGIKLLLIVGTHSAFQITSMYSFPSKGESYCTTAFATSTLMGL